MTDVTGYFQRQIALYPEKFGIGFYIARELRAELGEEFGYEPALLRLTTSVLRGKAVSEEQQVAVEFRFPATWWDHLMETLNRRLKLSIPVKYEYDKRTTKVKWNRKYLYPEANIEIPSDRFGAPVMWEEVSLEPFDTCITLTGTELSRFANRHEISSAVWRDMTPSRFGNTFPSAEDMINWLAQHGVNPDQLVARSAIR